jgi:hypothetical protein
VQFYVQVSDRRHEIVFAQLVAGGTVNGWGGCFISSLLCFKGKFFGDCFLGDPFQTVELVLEMGFLFA